MREIKFRGKCERTGEWVYGYLIKKRDVPYIVYENEEYGLHSTIQIETGSEGQSTGLKDVKGVEIYEGDILTSTEYPFQDENGYNYHGIVEWSNEDAAFLITKRLVNPKRRGISDGISGHLTDYDISEFEIIGNIYEHPHLLEGVK